VVIDSSAAFCFSASSGSPVIVTTWSMPSAWKSPMWESISLIWVQQGWQPTPSWK